MLTEVKEHFPNRIVLLALNLSQENELVLEGRIEDVAGKWNQEKAEFMLLLY